MSTDASCCRNCGEDLSSSGGARRPGPVASYCSNACRQAAYRKRVDAAVTGSPDRADTEASPSPPVSPLPTPLDSFVGREADLSELQALLLGSRLLTLTGPPGIGKTRLAIESVARVPERFPDGVWFVDLTTAPDPDLLLQAVAAAVGVRGHPGRPLLVDCVDGLSRRQGLLLLDNCEHIVDACAGLVVDLLAHCPELTVLCTSREALRVPGEVIYPLQGLPCEPTVTPDGPPPHDPDAVRLFVQRAVACWPRLTLTLEARQRARELCACLDGSPLAIELAARWVRILPVAEIVIRLSERFDLLVTGLRTVPDRQRSLHHALECSHATLDADERVVFRRLAVFAGWFHWEVANAVCAAGDGPAEAVLHALDGLETKSLLVPAGSGRFRLLESIRMFARERLDAAGELHAVYDRLLDWLAGGAASLVTEIVVTAEVHGWLTKEQDNLQHAVEWAIGQRDDRQVLLATALATCWMRKGDTGPSARLLERVLGNVTAPPAHRVLALTETAFVVWHSGEYERGRELAERAVALSRELDDPVQLARALQRLAMSLQVLGDLESALECLEERLALIRPFGLAAHTAKCLNDVAWTTIQHGLEERGRAALAEALTVVAGHDDPHLLAPIMHTAAAFALVRGELDRAEDCLSKILRYPDLDYEDIVPALEGLAIVAARRSQAERALQLIATTAATRAHLRLQAEPWWQQQINEAESAAQRLLTPDKAAAALEAGRRLQPDQIVGYALGELQLLAGQRQDPTTTPAMTVLTSRERQVATLVAEGLTNRQIARRLEISERTVESHVKSIRERLALDSRLAIAVWVTQGQRVAEAPASRR